MPADWNTRHCEQIRPQDERGREKHWLNERRSTWGHEGEGTFEQEVDATLKQEFYIIRIVTERKRDFHELVKDGSEPPLSRTETGLPRTHQGQIKARPGEARINPGPGFHGQRPGQ